MSRQETSAQKNQTKIFLQQCRVNLLSFIKAICGLSEMAIIKQICEKGEINPKKVPYLLHGTVPGIFREIAKAQEKAILPKNLAG